MGQIYYLTIGVSVSAYKFGRNHINDMVRVCELTAFVAFLSHFCFAILEGMKAVKPSKTNELSDISIRFEFTNKKIDFIENDIAKLAKLLENKLGLNEESK